MLHPCDVEADELAVDGLPTRYTLPNEFRHTAGLHYPEAVGYWAAYVWAFRPELMLVRRSRGEIDREQDKGSMRRILRTNQLAGFIAMCTAFLPWLSMPHPRLEIVLGTAFIVAGGVLRRFCFRALGQFFTGAVVVTEGHRVIETGPYRFVRHPSYTAGLLLFLGIGVGLGNWASIAIMTLPPLWAYLHRVRVEERALAETIGEPYVEYMKRTKRFIPFVI